MGPLLQAAALACEASWPPEAGMGEGECHLGDPTEEAILRAARGLAGEGTPESWALRLAEQPFDSEARRMAVLVGEASGGARAIVKGAPDVVLEACTRLRHHDREVPLGPGQRLELLAVAEHMAGRALRVLAVAERRGLAPDAPPSLWEREMTFLGLVGLMDPPRPEAAAAVAACQGAGIRVVMVTGDHPATAAAVAREVGILPAHGPREPGWLVTGRQMDTWDEERLTQAVAEARVFARVTPRHKLRVVRALKRRGEIVAMTGDGVNDAPALQEADIGVAMGRSGTDVTREAAAMILADDHFATLAAAIEEGRAIYDTLRKFIRYLLACNTGEVLTMFLAALAALPLPLLPIQILWVNLVTDGLPALALGLDPVEGTVMRRPPRPPGESVFARGLAAKILFRGAWIGLITVGVFVLSLRAGDPLPRARTLAFAVLTCQQLVHVFDCRSEEMPGLMLSPLTNLALVGAVASSALLFAATLYLPPLAHLFGTVPLTPTDWLSVLAASGAISLLETVRPRRTVRGLRPARRAKAA